MIPVRTAGRPAVEGWSAPPTGDGHGCSGTGRPAVGESGAAERRTATGAGAGRPATKGLARRSGRGYNRRGPDHSGTGAPTTKGGGAVFTATTALAP